MYKILYIERSRLLQCIIHDFLNQDNFRLFQTRTIEEALDVLEKHNINYIITEYELINETAEDFIKILNSYDAYRDIPVALLTSKASLELKHTFFELGVTDYILKNQIEHEDFEKILLASLINSHTKKVLDQVSIAVLDDSKLALNIIKRIFNNYNVTAVDYYKSGESLLASNTEYDVYILDLVLPKTTGKNIMLHIRERFEDNIIIFLSSVENSKIISDILKMGANDYILKPFSKQIFISRLENNVELFLMNKRLRELTKVDQMTELYNHHYICDYLDKVRAGQELSVVMLDIDDFKKVNDQYGHQMGDRIIIEIGNVLKEVFHKYGVVGRYGGEEYLVIILEDDIALIKELLMKTKNTITQRIHQLYQIHLTISGGYTVQKSESDHLIKKADEYLLKAKKMGKNKIIGDEFTV